MLRDGGVSDGVRYLNAESVAALHSGQVPEVAKTPHSFGGGFWADGSWGYGVFVDASGRYGWAGGLGTDFSVDPATGRITILLTQVEMGPSTWGAVFGFREVLLGQTPPTADDGGMNDVISADEFAANDHLTDWTPSGTTASARFATGSFHRGVEFVVAIGRAADAMDHHPDVDLRYDHVDVRLTSHDVGSLSERDARLAADISNAARTLGVRVEEGDAAGDGENGEDGEGDDA